MANRAGKETQHSSLSWGAANRLLQLRLSKHVGQLGLQQICLRFVAGRRSLAPLRNEHYALLELVCGNAVAFCAKSSHFGGDLKHLPRLLHLVCTLLYLDGDRAFQAVNVLLSLGELCFALPDCRPSLVGGPNGAAAQLGLPRTTLLSRMQRADAPQVTQSGHPNDRVGTGLNRIADAYEEPIPLDLANNSAHGVRRYEATVAFRELSCDLFSRGRHGMFLTISLERTFQASKDAVCFSYHAEVGCRQLGREGVT